MEIKITGEEFETITELNPEFIKIAIRKSKTELEEIQKNNAESEILTMAVSNIEHQIKELEKIYNVLNMIQEKCNNM